MEDIKKILEQDLPEDNKDKEMVELYNKGSELLEATRNFLDELAVFIFI